MNLTTIAGAILGLAVILAATAQASETTRSSTWNGYTMSQFQVDGRECILVAPRNSAKGNPLIWRTEFFGAFPEADIALLAKGFYVAYIDVSNMYGAPVAMGHMDRFYDRLTRENKLSRKVVLEGFSRGGLFAFNWAARNPEKVAAIYVDAPVCDMRSWPGGKGKGVGSAADWDLCKKVYGLTEEQAMAFKGNPIDNLGPIAKARIPILSVCGETDATVPIDENTRVVEKRYKELGGEILVIAKPFCDHHPHSLHDPIRIVNWVLKHTGHAELATEQAKTPYGYDYLTSRSSMDNTRIRFENQKNGRVVALGGSITQMDGWRDLVFADLKRRFPKTEFEFVSAGVASLGSTAHAFRLERDVLSKGPVDLLFVEAAVNDGTNLQSDTEQIRGMEGVIRQLLISDPDMDIVVLHFAAPSMLSSYRQGKTPAVIANHEKVAEYDGVNSVDLAKEVTERIHAGEFTWENDFKDLHPAPFGHKLYAATIGRLLDSAWNTPLPADAKMVPHAVKEQPLDKYSYYRGRLVPVEDAILGKGWTYSQSWNPRDGKETRPGFVDVPAVISNTVGAELKLKFDGSAVGVFVASGPDAGTVEFSIDSGPYTARSLFTPWSPSLYLPWAQVLVADLPLGKHELILRVSPDKDPKSVGHAIDIIHFLVN